MPRSTPQFRCSLLLPCAVIILAPATAIAQDRGKLQFGPPAGVAAPVYAPAARFTPPQALPGEAPGVPPQPVTLAAPLAPAPLEPLPAVPSVVFPPPPPAIEQPVALEVGLGFRETVAETVVAPALIVPVPVSDPRPPVKERAGRTPLHDIGSQNRSPYVFRSSLP